MNYTLNDEPIEIPVYHPRAVCYGPYERGMHDQWYREDNTEQYAGEYKQMYEAGKRNVILTLKTLRANF